MAVRANQRGRGDAIAEWAARGGVVLTQTERVRHLRPCADLLFRSIAKNYGTRGVAVILTGSLLAVVYIWKLVEILYFNPVSDTKTDDVKEAPLSLLLPLWLLAIANIYFGIDTSLTVGVAEPAANMLLGGKP